MSRVKQMADDEAAAAEAADTDEPADDTTDESADEPATDEPETPALSMEAALKAMDSEHTRHEQAVARIMGDDFESFAACPQCSGLGFTPKVPYKQHPALERCRACDGYGVLLTDSLNPERAVKACETCGGEGYVAKLPPMPDPNQYVQQPYQPPAPGYEPPRPYDLPQPPQSPYPGAAPGYQPPAAPMPVGS